MQGKILDITESQGGYPPIFVAPGAIIILPLPNHITCTAIPTQFTHILSEKASLRATLGGSPLALTGPLGSASLHLLLREATQVTGGSGIAALGEALLTTEAELLVALLALSVGATLAVASLGLAGLLDGDVEEIVGVVGRSRGVSLALCTANNY